MLQISPGKKHGGGAASLSGGEDGVAVCEESFAVFRTFAGLALGLFGLGCGISFCLSEFGPDSPRSLRPECVALRGRSGLSWVALSGHLAGAHFRISTSVSGHQKVSVKSMALRTRYSTEEEFLCSLRIAVLER